jgi:hypothetical protein
VSLKSAFHSLVDELDLADHVKDRLKEEVDVTEVPDTPPAAKEDE